MGRPKEFTREEVLLNAIPVFWKKGFSKTSLRDLEHATGVNKSGLYSEFKDKKEMFLESVKYYLRTRGGEEFLSASPQGWGNIRRFLKIGQTCYSGQRGCFAVNSLRDVAMMPPEAKKIIAGNSARLKHLLIANIKAELPGAKSTDVMADMLLTFFAGLCIEQNAKMSAEAVSRKITRFMAFLRHSA